MLVLSRKAGQRMRIGEDVIVTVLTCRNGQVRLGIDAPREMFVVREELRKAAAVESSSRRAR